MPHLPTARVHLALAAFLCGALLLLLAAVGIAIAEARDRLREPVAASESVG